MVSQLKKVHYSNCPVCGSAAIQPVLNVTDHSVSKEEFVIWQCSNCSLRFTQEVPDEASIERYYQSSDYISHSNINKGLVNQLYQKVRNHTLDQKAKLITAETVQNGKILDLGAGIGAFLNTMKKKGWEICGIEPNEGARRQARLLFDMDLKETGALNQLTPDSFDAITLWHVLEHVHQLQDYLERLKTLLKPEGKIFIAVPNYQSLDASLYQSYWAAYDVPRHLYHFTPQSINTLMEKHGLKVIAKKPMWFDSFYISLLSSQYKSGKTRWIGAVISAMRSNLKALLNKNYGSSIIYIMQKT